MYDRIQYSTEEIQEAVQTLRRLRDDAEKNLEELEQIYILLQESDFAKKNKDILEKIQRQFNDIKINFEMMTDKMYRINAAYEKIEQKNKKLIQKIENKRSGTGHRTTRTSHILKQWNGKITVRLECGDSFIIEDWLLDFLAQH